MKVCFTHGNFSDSQNFCTECGSKLYPATGSRLQTPKLVAASKWVLEQIAEWALFALVVLVVMVAIEYVGYLLGLGIGAAH